MYVISSITQAVVQEVTVVGTSMGASTIWSYIELFGEDRIARAVFVDQAPLQVHIRLQCYTVYACCCLTALLTTRLRSTKP